MAYRCIQPFTAPLTADAAKRGAKRGPGYRYGQLVPESDPVLKEYPQFFEPVDALTERVEQATAAPGEVRNVKAPKKKK